MDPINEFCENLHNFLTGGESSYNKNANLFKKNSEKLKTNGDISFPVDMALWKSYLRNKECDNTCNILQRKRLLADGDSEDADDGTCLTAASAKWNLQIHRTHIDKNHCNLFLSRLVVYENFIGQVLTADSNYGQFAKEKMCRVRIQSIDNDIEDCEHQPITNYRLSLIENVIKNLVQLSSYTLLGADSPEVPDYNFCLATKSTTKQQVPENSLKIMCGIVLDPAKERKMANVSAADYIGKRSTDMQLMAQHKYGLRVRNEKVFVDLIQRLGLAAVTVDMLEVKHSRPVALNTTGVTSSSKGAAFILYNSARLETLFRTFEEKVSSGFYPRLPELHEVDLKLLVEEEEWQLMYNFILGFPLVIDRCIGDLAKGLVNPHLLCNFLSQFAATFSVYYRRVRILTENRPQLLPVMYSRIYLLKSLQIVFNKILKLLDIEPVKQM